MSFAEFCDWFVTFTPEQVNWMCAFGSICFGLTSLLWLLFFGLYVFISLSHDYYSIKFHKSFKKEFLKVQEEIRQEEILKEFDKNDRTN